MRNEKSPCFHCKEHTASCHSSCEIYKQWAEDKKKRNDFVKEQKYKNYLIEQDRKARVSAMQSK